MCCERSFMRLADCAAVADLAVVDADVEAAFRITAHPRLELYRRAVPTIVAQRQHRTLSTFPALRKRNALHAVTSPLFTRALLHQRHRSPGVFVLERAIEVEHPD